MRYCIASVATLLIFALGGCGGGEKDTYPVSGVVKYPDGSPVVRGRVTFTSVGGTTGAAGLIQPDGRYTLGTTELDNDALPGRYTVAILGANEPPEPAPYPEPEGYVTKIKPLVAEKYTSTKTSELEVEVKREDNTIDLTVERP